MPTAKGWTLAATIIASSMTFIDGTVVNVALPALQAGLGASVTDVQWVVEAYALFLGALILVGGSLGDQFGRKRVFLVGVGWFTVASVLCGLAPTPLVLTIGRALQGIGAAFLVPGSLAIISATFTGDERGRAIGTWSGFSAITTAIGPVTGGWLVEHASWRAVFFMNVPLAIIVTILSVRYVEETKDPSRRGPVDWLGLALAVLGLSGVVFGLLEWPPLGAGHPLVFGALIGGSLGIGLFIAVEARVHDPMLPLGLFRSRPFTLANVLTLFLYAALGEMLFLLPLDLIQVRGYSPAAAGAALLPFPVILFALSRWSGGLVARVGARLPLVVGPATAGLGFVLFAAAPASGAFATTILPAVVVLGLGMAVTVAPLTTTVMNSVSEAQAGVASGVNNAVSRVAGLIAIAVFGVIVSRDFNSRAVPPLERMAITAEVRASLNRELAKMAGADVDSIAGLSPQDRDRARRAIDGAFAGSFRLAMAGTAVLAFAAAAVGAALR